MMIKRKLGVVFGIFIGLLMVGAVVSAAPYYKKISQCTWYGEDYETKSLSLMGGRVGVRSGVLACMHPLLLV